MSYPLTRISTATVGRERSADLWRGVLEAYANDPCIGALRSNDFSDPHAQAVNTYSEGWFVSEDGAAGATSESFNTTGAADGHVSLSATTGTVHQAVKAQAGPTATVSEGIILPTATAGKADVVFEARVELRTTLNPTCFIGLAEQNAAVLSATSVPSDALDYIGFYRLDNGDLQFIVRNDNNGGTAVEYNVNIVASANVPNTGFTKLGFRVNHDNKVEIFIDGVQVKATSDTGAKIAVPSTALPIEVLARTLLTGRGATAANATSTIVCDRIECFVAE